MIQYILDGYKHTHNPDEQSVNERTTGRELNVLDPPSKYSMPSSRSSRPSTIHGRPISPSQITHPRPSKPQQAYNHLTQPSRARDLAIETLSRQLRHQVIDSSDESEFSSDNDSLPSDQPSSHTSSSDDESDSEIRTPDSYTSNSRGFSPDTPASSPEVDYNAPLPQCYCGIYGITRTGERIKIDCYGQRCGYKKSRCTAKARSNGGSGSGSPGSSSDSGRDYKVKVETRRPTSYKNDRCEVRSTRRK